MLALRSTLVHRRMFHPTASPTISAWMTPIQANSSNHDPPHPPTLGGPLHGTTCRSLKSWSRKRILRQKIQASLARQREPAFADAAAMPLSYQAMDNSTLTVLGRMGNHSANKEILKRHIMVTDGVSYGESQEMYKTISKKNKEHMFLLGLPYQLGIASALGFGILAIPMVFHKGTALWFNRGYVTTDVPEPADLETILEVGAWTWNWMEPAIGTVSFVLLSLQFSRAQVQNLGINPYTKRVKQWRAERLASAFPKYDTAIVMAYSKSATIRKRNNPGLN